MGPLDAPKRHLQGGWQCGIDFLHNGFESSRRQACSCPKLRQATQNGAFSDIKRTTGRAAIRKGPPYAIDSWGLGCLIQEVFSGHQLTRTEELRNTACIPKTLLPDYQRLLSSAPARRLNPAKLIDNSGECAILTVGSSQRAS
ncbi:unnamed protein product [Closterium sp. NIES-53]